MRKNQISIKVERFGDQVPKNIPSTHQIISVYADSNDFSAALLEAIHLLMNEIEKLDISDVTSVVNVDNLSGTQQRGSDIDKLVRKIHDEKYSVSRALKKAKIELAAMEHAEETAHIISDAENLEEAERCLCERFELGKWEMRTWLDTNIIFATKSDIADKRKDIEELQERFDILSAQSDAFDEI